MRNAYDAASDSKAGGIVFWGVDYDMLAAEVGSRMSQSPPSDVQIIQYAGKKDFEGWHKINDQGEYVNVDPNMFTAEQREALYKIDRPVVKQIRKWEKELINRHNVKYSLELHDTQHTRRHVGDDERWHFNISLEVSTFNPRLFHLMEGYCPPAKTRFHNNGHILSYYADMAVLNCNPNQIILEIWYDPIWHVRNQIINDCCLVLQDMTQYINKNYV